RDAFLGFARLAPVLIALLIAAGVYLSILRLPTLSDLWSSSYGQVLLVKLSLVSAALAWGAFHHFVARPRIDKAGWTRRRLVGEGAVAMTILLLAAILVNAKPPPQSPRQSDASPVARDGRVRGKDAGSVRSRRLRARLRTPHRAAQRAPTAPASF